jgi:hypothetical protein
MVPRTYTNNHHVISFVCGCIWDRLHNLVVTFGAAWFRQRLEMWGKRAEIDFTR